jgi:hypothetical protein
VAAFACKNTKHVSRESWCFDLDSNPVPPIYELGEVQWMGIFPCSSLNCSKRNYQLKGGNRVKSLKRMCKIISVDNVQQIFWVAVLDTIFNIVVPLLLGLQSGRSEAHPSSNPMGNVILSQGLSAALTLTTLPISPSACWGLFVGMTKKVFLSHWKILLANSFCRHKWASLAATCMCLAVLNLIQYLSSQKA